MLRARPLTLKQANDFIAQHHRHHKPVQGHRFSIGAERDGVLVGVCVVGRPVARGCDTYNTAEVTRLATDGSKNVCSFLYSSSARAAQAMGFSKIQTYILDSEPGTTLKAVCWEFEDMTNGGSWKHTAGPRRQDQPTGPKARWSKKLN